MSRGKYVFPQVKEYYPSRVFNKAVKIYNADYYVRVSSSAMCRYLLFGQLSGYKSLNDISLILKAHEKHLYRMGFPKGLYPENIRMVEYLDGESSEVITFITNNMDLGLLVIANIYRNRWQIETFFKWIKQNLTIKALGGYSKNAVQTQLWVAICAYLLLAWIKVDLKSPLSVTGIATIVEVSILSKTDIKELIHATEPLTINQDVNKLTIF